MTFKPPGLPSGARNTFPSAVLRPRPIQSCSKVHKTIIVQLWDRLRPAKASTAAGIGRASPPCTISQKLLEYARVLAGNCVSIRTCAVAVCLTAA
jgi:hypothetical protein